MSKAPDRIQSEPAAVRLSEDDSFLRAAAHVPDVAPRLPARDRIGEELGPFCILEKIGEGGMGVIYAALDKQLQRKVALKVLPATRGEDTERVHRFTAEAEMLASLDHPGIVQYVAHGTTSDGEPFLAMEWLDGEDLSRRLRRSRLSVIETVALGRLVAEALSIAHARGIIHRDIKPNNLFLPGGEIHRVRVLDFGVARLGHALQAFTATGMLIGTPGYMAPEQARGDNDWMHGSMCSRSGRYSLNVSQGARRSPAPTSWPCSRNCSSRHHRACAKHGRTYRRHWMI
jgi:serine/threonine protein kinase